MAAPENNYGIYKKNTHLFTELPFICIINLKFVEHREKNFFLCNKTN